MSKKKRRENTIVKQILDEFNPKSVEDVQDALKEVFGPLFEAMLQGEMNNHLGYENNNKDFKETNNRRNGYGSKTLKTTMGDVEIDVPRDRDASFEPEIIPKRTSDVSAIESKVLAMYAKGMSQRDISATIEDIYGFSISHEKISDITDMVLPEIDEWQQRPLDKCYPFIFVDCMYVTIRNQYEVKDYAVYTILGYKLDGSKEILGIWLNESESKNRWMQIFDEIRSRGVEDIFFISMDGVSGLEEGSKSIFPNVVVQRCIVHLIRNSLKYVPSKDYKTFTASLKKVYGASSFKAYKSEYEKFKSTWSQYPGALDVWERNIIHVEQLYDYSSDIRRIMYTTNPIESVHSSFRKVTKKGAFPNEDSLIKLLYLRVTELSKKWTSGKVRNWSMVLNQLSQMDKFKERIIKYSSDF
ncbi:MAG: IS256 family transposase [Clostridiales bacterium]|nr:IS256 family transposase [Clostridiales bacterium]